MARREKDDDVSDIATRAEEAADISLGSAEIAQKAAGKVLDALPTPDPREDVNYQRLAGLEQSMLARISPRHRNRWPELLAFDERVTEIDRRQEGLRNSLIELRGRRERADADYAAALAGWMANGQADSKPVSEATALEEAIVEADAEHAAMDTLRDRVLEERIAFVQRHRKRLVLDAERATEQAKQRYLELVEEIAKTREELVGLRETSVWASLYPSETLQTFAPSHVLVGGRRKATEQHLPDAKQPIPAHAVLGLLRADAEHFATVQTLEQAAEAKGVSTAELTGDEAMWAGSDADKAWQKRDRERRIKEHESVFGRPPSQFGGFSGLGE